MLGVVPTLGTLASRRRAVVVGVAGLAAFLLAIAWLSGGSAPVRDLAVERRALETRLTQLNTLALAPGSALACLDALAGESVETACEKTLFASPASVASATSYIAARFDLLADLVAYGKYGGRGIDGMLLPLRRSLESDRFGFVAHMLAIRDGCTSQNCSTLALLRDTGRVRANLSGGTLDRYVEHYVTIWNQSPDNAVADATPTPGSGQPGASNAPHKLVNIDFPTAASIPAISIMNPEPKGSAAATGPASVAAGSPGAEPSAPAAAAGAKRTHKQAGNPPPPQATLAPASPVDPVWLPGTVPTPVPAATTSASPPGGTPLQLNPTQPEASANNSRTQ